MLIVEDAAEDAELLASELRRFGFEFELGCAYSLDELSEALAADGWSIVLSGYEIRGRTAFEALEIVRAHSRELPFIVVSATLGVEAAVDIIRAGANDYVMKDRLVRLGPAVERELRDVQLRAERRALFEALRRSEDRYRRIFEQAPVGVAVSTADGRFVTVNDRFAAIVGATREQIAGHLADEFDLAGALDLTNAIRAAQDRPLRRRNGDVLWISLTLARIGAEGGEVEQIVWLVEDITARKKAEDELEWRAVQQAAVANLGQAGLSGESVEALLRRATGMIAEYVGVELCAIFEKRGDAVRLVGSQGWDESLTGRGDIPISETTQVAHTLKTAAPVIVEDFRRETRFPISALLRGQRVVSGMTVPVVAGDDVPWGVLAAHTRRLRQFTTGDVDYLRAVAAILGQAIERRRAEDQLRMQARQQTAVAEVNRLAVQSADRAIERAVAILQEQTHARAAFFRTGADVSGAVTATVSDHGVLAVFPREGQQLPAAVIALMQLFANTIAEAIDRENARRALAESERRYREVVEGASEVIFTISDKGRFTSLNAAFEKVTGWPVVEWIGRPYLDLIAPDDRVHSGNVFRAVIERQEAAADELAIIAREGKKIVEVTSFPKTEDGRTVAIYGFARDVTERRRTERERQQLTRNLQLLLESTVEGIVTADLEGRCTMVNTTAARLLRRSRQEMLQAPLHEMLHTCRDERTCSLLKTARLGVVQSAATETFCRSDGSVFPVEYSSAPVLDEGVRVGVVFTFNDITERRMLESKLEQANRVASLGRLAATIAHEFNNVLMGISPFVELIRQGRKIDVAVDQITRAVARGKRVTQDILRFTQPAEPVRVTFDVEPWLQNIALEARTLLPPTVELDVGADTPGLQIDGDPNQLHQALTNLILNARDAMPHGGLLSIRARREPAGARLPVGVVSHPERFVHFIVRDTGEGMTEETLRHIFEPLFTTKRSGTGLGVPVANQVVSRHGGEMFVESEVGVGTTFHLLVPLGKGLAEAPAPEPPPEIAPAARRVLLVEDDEIVSVGVTALLEINGLEVELARTGAEAIEAVRRNPPDVVVLDVGLPDMDGTAVYAAIAETHPSLPVIFSTGHADRSKIEDVLMHPHVAYLLKPYEAEALLGAIREVVNG